MAKIKDQTLRNPDFFQTRTEPQKDFFEKKEKPSFMEWTISEMKRKGIHEDYGVNEYLDERI